MPSAKNTEVLQKSKDLLKEGKGFYFTDFTGLTVRTLESLRRELKNNRGDYLVIKNTLGDLTFREMGLEESAAKKVFVGSTGIAIAYDDPVVLAKILKETVNLKIKGALIEGAFYDTQAILRLSQISSKTVLYGELVGALNIIGNMVGVLEGALRNFLYTIEAIRNKETK